MRLYNLLLKAALKYPDNIAVVDTDSRISYSELLISVGKVANRIKGLDLTPGSPVAILFENSIDYVTLFFAITKSGHTIVPLDTSLAAKSLAQIINDSEAELLACQGRFKRIHNDLIPACPAIKHVISDVDLPKVSEGVQVTCLGDMTDTIDPEEIDPDNIRFEKDPDHPHELSAIFYTSGSTGSSKGVMLSHLNLISNTLATIEYLKLEPEDSVIVILPFHYIYGNSLMLTHLAVGARLVIDNRFMYPELIMDTMERERITGFSGVPSNFMILLNKSTFAKRRFPSLRYFTQAGGAMAPGIISRIRKAHPNIDLIIMYGQTEASPRVTYLPPELVDDNPGSIGIPLSGVGISLVDQESQEVSPGEVGEIVVSGDNVMIGYHNQPGEQNEVLREGKLYTGDLARQDQGGLLYIVGRKKEIIKTGGNRVSSREVEDTLLGHPHIAEAAVFGRQDDILGEAVIAAVVKREGTELSESDIREFCRKQMADHKAPRIVLFVESLPKTQSGKIDRKKLPHLK